MRAQLPRKNRSGDNQQHAKSASKARQLFNKKLSIQIASRKPPGLVVVRSCGWLEQFGRLLQWDDRWADPSRSGCAEPGGGIELQTLCYVCLRIQTNNDYVKFDFAHHPYNVVARFVEGQLSQSGSSFST